MKEGDKKRGGGRRKKNNNTSKSKALPFVYDHIRQPMISTYLFTAIK